MQNFTYVVDVNNKKIKWAMERLGVKPEELQKKMLEDFLDSSISRDLQFVRFEFYKRNIEKTVKLIKETSKTYNLENNKHASKFERISKSNEAYREARFSRESKERSKKFLNNKDKEVIIHALESTKFFFTPQTPTMNEKRKRKKDKFKEFHKKQKENQIKLRNEQEMIWNRTVSPIKVPERSASHLDRHGKFHSSTHSHSSPNNEYTNIEEKLHSYEEKQAKSSVIHNNFIEKRKELAKTPEKPRKVCETNEEVSLNTLQKLIKKDFELKKRKLKQLNEHKEKYDQLKRFKESQSLKVVKHNQEQLKILEEKAEALKIKESQIENIVNSQKQAVIKGIELKAQIHKLKDEQASINAKRLQKIDSHKKQGIIDKLLLQKEKFEEMKQLKERMNIKSREESIRDMIQRERIKESVFQIQKSPLSKCSQRLLRDLKIDVPPERPKSNNIRTHKKHVKSDVMSPRELN